MEVAEGLEEKGMDAVSLEGGYIAWLLDAMKQEEEVDICKDVELSIRKKFRKSIWCKFTKAINQYELVKPGDRIAVCISGGKDSMLMAKLFSGIKNSQQIRYWSEVSGHGSGIQSGKPKSDRGKRQKTQYSDHNF